MSFVIAVDDDPEVLDTLGRVLDHEELEYELVNSGEQGLEAVYQRKPDLLILDIIMPGLDGIAVCSKIRSDPTYRTMPILFLTAKGSTDDIVLGLDVGGDDYVVKPFELLELSARIRALLRRNEAVETQPKRELLFNDIKLDLAQARLYVLDEMIQLTSTEFRLMHYMMKHPSTVIALDELLVKVWDYPEDTGDPDLVRAHMRNLRTKVERNPQHNYLQTVFGAGYMFAPNEALENS